MPINLQKTVYPMRYCPSCGGKAKHCAKTTNSAVLSDFAGVALVEFSIWAAIGIAILFFGHQLSAAITLLIVFGIVIIAIVVAVHWERNNRICECNDCKLQLPLRKFLKNNEKC